MLLPNPQVVADASVLTGASVAVHRVIGNQHRSYRSFRPGRCVREAHAQPFWRPAVPFMPGRRRGRPASTTASACHGQPAAPRADCSYPCIWTAATAPAGRSCFRSPSELAAAWAYLKDPTSSPRRGTSARGSPGGCSSAASVALGGVDGGRERCLGQVVGLFDGADVHMGAGYVHGDLAGALLEQGVEGLGGGLGGGRGVVDVDGQRGAVAELGAQRRGRDRVVAAGLLVADLVAGGLKTALDLR